MGMLTNGKLLALTIVSVVMLALMTCVSLGLMGLSAQLLKQAQDFEKLIHVLPKVVELGKALRLEAKAVFLKDAADIQAAAIAGSEVAEEDFVAQWRKGDLDSLSVPGYYISDFDAAYYKFHKAAQIDKVYEYGKLTEQLVTMVDEAALHTYDRRMVNSLTFFDSHFAMILGYPAVSHVAIFNKIGRFTDKKFIRTIIKAEVAGDVHYLNQDSSLSQITAHIKNHVVAEAKSLKKNALPLEIPVVESTVKAVLEEMDTLALDMEAASAEAVNRKFHSASFTIHVVLFAVLAVVSCVACVACILVLRRNWHYSSQWKNLLLQFRDSDELHRLREQYRPLIKDMQQGGQMDTSPSEVEQTFQDATRLVSSLRPFVPQTLFGDYATADGAAEADAKMATLPKSQLQRERPSGSTSSNASTVGPAVVTSNASITSTSSSTLTQGWDIGKESARLETGSAVVRCTVLLFAAMPPANFDRNNGEELQKFFNHVLAVATSSVNKFGGVIHQVSADGRVLAVWNATHMVSKPAFEALRAAELIRRRILAGTRFDVNVSTGPCLVCNSKIADSKNVLLFGYPFELVEKMLTLNRIHDAWLMVDSDTYESIPRSHQTRCKPVGVLHGQTGESVVVLSYGSEEPMKGVRWKAYNTAFTLYRNGFIQDAITEFRSYLETYSHDSSAKWLLDTVLLPKQHDPVQALKSRERLKPSDADTVVGAGN